MKKFIKGHMAQIAMVATLAASAPLLTGCLDTYLVYL